MIKLPCFARLGLVTLALVTAACLFASTDANAQTEEQKAKALELFRKGQAQANLGNFDQAIQHFKDGFLQVPDESFLFNIGQAFRLKGDCKQALFFYKRFLSLSRRSKDRKLNVEEEVRGRIPELEQACEEKDQEEAENSNQAAASADESIETAAPEPATGGSAISASTTGAAPSGEIDAAAAPGSPEIVQKQVAAGPRALLVAGEIGAGFMSLPRLEGALFSVRLSAAYPMPAGPITLAVGGLLGLTPIPWEHRGNSGTASLWTTAVSVAGYYAVDGKLSVNADLALGAQHFTGLIDGNSFTENAVAKDLLSMFNLRIGIGASYALLDNLVITAAPFVLSLSPTPGGLAEDVTSLTRVEVLAGIGYRR